MCFHKKVNELHISKIHATTPTSRPTNSLILIKILSSSFTGQLLSALESKVKHAQCFDVALMDDGSVVLASKDYRLYIYRYVQLPPMGMLN